MQILSINCHVHIWNNLWTIYARFWFFHNFQMSTATQDEALGEMHIRCTHSIGLYTTVSLPLYVIYCLLFSCTFFLLTCIIPNDYPWFNQCVGLHVVCNCITSSILNVFLWKLQKKELLFYLNKIFASPFCRCISAFNFGWCIDYLGRLTIYCRCAVSECIEAELYWKCLTPSWQFIPAFPERIKWHNILRNDASALLFHGKYWKAIDTFAHIFLSNSKSRNR